MKNNVRKLRHIIKEYRKVSMLCEMSGGKAMKFHKYAIMKWKELKGVTIK